MATVHPPLEELPHLATRLNAGEQRVLDRLVALLDDRWHIFVEPHVLNLHPDLLVCAEHHGATVIEVKDWAPGHYRDRNGRLEVCDPTGDWWRSREDPLSQVHRYRKLVAGSIVSPPGSDEFPSVRGAVVVPRFDENVIRDLLRGTTDLPEASAKWIGVAGTRAMNDKDAGRQLVLGAHRQAKGLPPATFRRLLDRLREPEAIAEQRRPLKLSDGAANVMRNPNNAGIRRVRGPAGSGKTLGLAARAAVLAGEGKTVLLLTFNITLAHYAQDLVRRHVRQLGADHRLVDCIHFHGFCSSVKEQFAGERVAIDDDSLAGYEILVAHARQAYEKQSGPRYDAILVDEGQDFLPEWWQFLRADVCRPGGEMVLAADKAQDIYDRASWTEEPSMRACGFSGRWTELEGSYRLPPDLIPIVRDFADNYLPDTDLQTPTEPADRNGTAAAPTRRRWINLDPPRNNDSARVAAATADAVVKLLDQPEAPHPADVAVLSNNHETGALVVDELAARGYHVESIFDPEKDGRRRRKVRFWPGVNAIKGSTVHSFKGWEARAIVAVIEPGHPAQDAVLAYVALSRVKGEPSDRPAFVTVVNAAPQFRTFKERFERSVGADEAPALAGQLSLTSNPTPEPF